MNDGEGKMLRTLAAALLIAVVTDAIIVAFKLGVRSGHQDARCPSAISVTLDKDEVIVATSWLHLAGSPEVSASNRTQFVANGLAELDKLDDAIGRIPAPACYAGGGGS